MKLTKEDYMRLPKERLAELLVEMQETPTITTPEPGTIRPTLPVWAGCDGTICLNPQISDCINCPRRTSGGVYTSPNTATGTSTLKAEG